MHKIAETIKKNKQTLFTVLLYGIIMFFINLRGPLIDNDTIEYIRFAQIIEEGNFPYSRFYQPGLGFMIYFVKSVFFTDFLTAFRIVNSIAGLGLILTLKGFWNMAYGEHKILPVILASTPTIIYLSSLLYADIVFDFLAFTAILFLVRAYKDRFSFSALFWSSILTTLAIFTKYNALVVLVCGLLFILLNYVFVRHELSLLLKKILVFCILPFAYLLFWKLFNGSLAMVEFTKWIEPVTLDCIFRYLKINWISTYHLLLDRGFIGLELFLNHKLILLLNLLIVGFLIYRTDITLNRLIIYTKKNRAFLVILLFTLMYTFALNTMESLNCRKEPSVRLYSVCFIGLGFLILGSIYKLFYVINRPLLITGFIVSATCYNALVLIRIYGDTEGVVIDMKNKPYIETISYLKTQKKSGQVAGFATPKFNRYWFAMGGDFKAMGIFSYQHHHEMDHNYVYDDSTYLEMVNGKLNSLNTGQFLVVEMETNFMNKQLHRLSFSEKVFHSGNLMVFRKQ
ncbi:MAG: ArnT family glycosyltransferase [Sphingomonadales bacterium]|jgi:hypothetical protein